MNINNCNINIKFWITIYKLKYKKCNYYTFILDFAPAIKIFRGSSISKLTALANLDIFLTASIIIKINTKK